MNAIDSKRIWLSSPHMGGTEQDFVKKAFETNWVAPLGPNVDGFEKDIQSYLGNDVHVAALSSGTAALHLGLKLLGVSEGDEVLCQSMTFAASANPIVYLGAKPVFIDSERDTWNICAEQLEIAIKDRIAKGKKPKAIVAVHLYGMPYNVEAVHSIASEYRIPILEDSAEAFGSTYHGVKCGTFGDIAILSFNGNKIITTSGGGALISKDPKHREKAIFLATQARDNAPHYEHSEIGYNYRISNITAGIGRGQMQVLDSHVANRRRNFDFYKKHLENSSEIKFLEEPQGYFANRWLTCIETSSYELREKIRLSLADENIESRPLWKPMHQQAVFADCATYLNGISDDLFDRGLCLPSGSNLEEEDLYRIVSVIKKVLK
ncbi:aminotransferase class I/II-fold pyridoxal phosphate-dependent enzyme [Aquimarina sp. AD10]|uniref:Pyridoxal phosphate-dependent aminotransferase n=1 Tax=Aquimarina aggregata TaxID=1642818 RepID=A0A163C6J0_9FLAO|nr:MULTISPECIES: aminotransferase class I/II-fold pyridoxal phosphate-dependent enzyme [Aquimarina]AXT59914.1 aminotransferase class I/II-fold pyridoxal phosphate-dependent enzyme [Aquimarina sp. AD10]KZS42096.1 pyridoxal phosphate-dependent aminotransferase [Aquimarina aggregata]RKN00168.1 aminotransferase class I/II-fold pyridoxal phosphate-dependent enzyme [Aquimarina sp. AD10]